MTAAERPPMSDVIAAIMNRHAIRKYTAKQVPEDILEQILEKGATMAPKTSIRYMSVKSSPTT